MLAEYALIPEVFDQVSYSSHEVCDLRLSSLRDCLLTRGVVRNLHDGEWWEYMERQKERWHFRGKEILRKLKLQGRLCYAAAATPTPPADATAWCRDALASHDVHPIQGIVVDDATHAEFASNRLVAPISRLGQATWWQGDSNSVELRRDSNDYQEVLAPLLRHSNSLMFVDAHLNPTERRYADFGGLLAVCAGRQVKPLIEIHRVLYKGSGPNRHLLSETECRGMFHGIARIAQKNGMKIEVFVWNDFHDRFLISNLMGIQMPNGFDVDLGPPGLTRWARLDRKDRDSVQREFDPANRMHTLHYRFTL